MNYQSGRTCTPIHFTSQYLAAPFLFRSIMSPEKTALCDGQGTEQVYSYSHHYLLRYSTVALVLATYICFPCHI